MHLDLEGYYVHHYECIQDMGACDELMSTFKKISILLIVFETTIKLTSLSFHSIINALVVQWRRGYNMQMR